MITIITPVLNEEENIRPFLENINECEGKFEVILIDGGSSDSTLKEAERTKKSFEHPLKIVTSAKGRAEQMNSGAKHARGDILLFLHVDSLIEQDALNLIEDAVRNNKIIGGGLTQSFSEPDLLLRIISRFGNIRARLTKIFYGDYGIFIKRDIFIKMGGYDNIRFLEDVEFCRKAKRFGDLIQVDRKIKTSPRRYEQIGKLKLTVIFSIAVFFNSLGKRPEFLRRYIVDK
jgi:rSAM/selenodomain-associated transferase 2